MSTTPTPVGSEVQATHPLSGGRFTIQGSATLELRLTRLLDEIAAQVGALVPATWRPTLVLFGGYGRGEGGVEVRNGTECLHNNLDLLLVTRVAPPPSLTSDVASGIRKLARSSGIDVDLTVLSERALRRSPCRLMWYEMRHGHRILLGDPRFLLAFDRFELSRVLASDVRNMLANRGTLLLINEHLLSQAAPSPDTRRTVVKHLMKAIVGYGDALLFFSGRYHWSYSEKLHLMQGCDAAPPDLRDLYAQAIAFRFAPRYDEGVPRDLREYNASLLSRLAAVHLRCESSRLALPHLRWDTYLQHALRRVPLEENSDPRAAARKARNLCRSPVMTVGGTFLERCAVRMAGPSDLLAIVFPLVAYGVAAPAQADRVRSLLNSKDATEGSLRDRYLDLWCRFGDSNARIAPPAGAQP